MKKFEVAYLPIGVPTFHLESAEAEFMKSIRLLEEICPEAVFPEEMLLTMEKLESFLDQIDPDLLIIQNITFANAAYASAILNRFKCPVVLWTLREPVIDGGRLRLNSLTGAYSAANTIREFRDEPFEYFYGSPEEAEVKRGLSAVIGAARMKEKLHHLRLAAVGHTPQGFGFGRALDADLLKTFGVTLEAIEARELIDVAKMVRDEEAKEILATAGSSMKGLEKIPEKNQLDFARLYKAYHDYVEQNGIGALATRCWPDFFTAFGTPVCAVLAILNDLGIPAACEADIYGALSMYISSEMTGTPVFFGDPVSLSEEENSITFWHCGTAACSLARTDIGAKVGVHCNRKIGPTLDFGCKPCDNVTVFRVGRNPDGSFRFFIEEGKALDKPKQFNGTSVVVKMKKDVKEIVTGSVKAGWEPHFVVAYGDIKEELTALAHMLGITIWEKR